MGVPVTVLRLLGQVVLAVTAAALLGVFVGLTPSSRPLDGYLFLLALQGVIGAALLIAAKLKQANDPLAPRMVPSTLVAMLLYLLMALRWLTEGP